MKAIFVALCAMISSAAYAQENPNKERPENFPSVKMMVQRLAELVQKQPPKLEEIESAISTRLTPFRSSDSVRVFAADMNSTEYLERIEVHEYLATTGEIEQLDVTFRFAPPEVQKALSSPEGRGPHCIATGVFASQSTNGWTLQAESSPFSAREAFVRHVDGATQKISIFPNHAPGSFRCAETVYFSAIFKNK